MVDERPQIPSYKPGDRLGASFINKLTEMSVDSKNVMPGSYTQGGVGKSNVPPPFAQRLVKITASEFPVGNADNTAGVYEIQFKYYDSDKDEWLVDDDRGIQFLDGTATNDAFSVGDEFVAYWNEQRGMWIKVGGGSSAAVSGGDSSCPCMECVPSEQAVVGGCAAAPNGAPHKYTMTTTKNVFSDLGGTLAITTFTYGFETDCVDDDDSSGSVDDDSSGSIEKFHPGNCSWWSCPVELCDVDLGLALPTAQAQCGFYQLELELTRDSNNNIVQSIYIVYANKGDDWIGTGT